MFGKLFVDFGIEFFDFVIDCGMICGSLVMLKEILIMFDGFGF